MGDKPELEEVDLSEFDNLVTKTDNSGEVDAPEAPQEPDAVADDDEDGEDA